MASDGWKTAPISPQSNHRWGKGELDRLIVAIATDQHGVTIDRIPCTSVPATLLPVAGTAPRNVLASACQQAEVQGVLEMRAVDELLERRRGQPGTSTLRAVLEVDGIGIDRTKSTLERRFLRLARGTGLPAPAVNEWMAIPGEETQCDFVWHRERLVVELDGWDTHRTRRAFQGDRRLDRLLRLHGWDVVRLTGHDIERNTDEVVKAVQTLLQAARRGPRGPARYRSTSRHPRIPDGRLGGGRLAR